MQQDSYEMSQKCEIDAWLLTEGVCSVYESAFKKWENVMQICRESVI